MKIILKLDLSCLKVAGQDLVEFVYLKMTLSGLQVHGYLLTVQTLSDVY